MKSYELTYLISSELTEEEAKQLQGKIISFVQAEGGILVSEGSLLKRTLAYQVKRQAQAFLTTLIFQLEAGKLIDLEKKIKEEANILRYILIIKPPAREMPLRRRRISTLPPEKPTRPSGKKVELKEIDKKLEEILKE